MRLIRSSSLVLLTATSLFAGSVLALPAPIPVTQPSAIAPDSPILPKRDITIPSINIPNDGDEVLSKKSLLIPSIEIPGGDANPPNIGIPGDGDEKLSKKSMTIPSIEIPGGDAAPPSIEIPGDGDEKLSKKSMTIPSIEIPGGDANPPSIGIPGDGDEELSKKSLLIPSIEIPSDGDEELSKKSILIPSIEIPGDGDEELSKKSILIPSIEIPDGGETLSKKTVTIPSINLPDDDATLSKKSMTIPSIDLPGGGDLGKADLPYSNGHQSLSPPTNLHLKSVLIGRGTQNYTCADSTAKSTPVPNGAVATLYDASHLAKENKTKLHKIPGYLVTRPEFAARKLFHKVGKHFSYDATTPVFVINGPSGYKGKLVGKKVENIAAPAGAPVGRKGVAFGAVDWLHLVEKDSGPHVSPNLKSVGYKAVYRVETAGGKPPATCEGMPAEINMPYSAEYWFYD